MYDTSVLIIGAGPTGLTLAVELARRSVDVRILDASAVPFNGSRGKGLQPRTLEIFDDLGVVAAMLKAGMPYPHMRVHLGPLSFRLGPLGGKRQATEGIPYPNLWLVPQQRTEAILRERLAEMGRHVEFGTSFTSLAQQEQQVMVRLSTGESLTTRYLIGCDGAHSSVRKAIGLELQGNALTEKLSYVADVEIPELDHAVWHVWPLMKGGSIGLCPLPEKSLFQMTAPYPLPGSIEETVAKVSRCKVMSVHWSSTYRPARRMVESYRVGNVFLAGDAAHVHPPAGGQGLNTGVQDAYNLGWKLTSVLHGGPESLLDTYQEERLPVATAVLGLTTQLHKSRSLKRGEATNQLSLHYRGSTLSSGASFGQLEPGDRMPNMRLSDGTTLFARMRGIHATEVVTRTGIRILVRPDGYIAAIGTQKAERYAGELTCSVECGADDI